MQTGYIYIYIYVYIYISSKQTNRNLLKNVYLLLLCIPSTALLLQLGRLVTSFFLRLISSLCLIELFCLLFGFLFVSPPLRRCLDTDPENILFGTLNNRNPKIPENLLFIFSRYFSVVLLNELIAVCLGAVWTPNSL